MLRRTPLRTKTPLRAKAPIKRRPSKRARRQTQAEKDYMADVAKLGCIIANKHCSGRRTVHHRSGAGGALRANDYDTFCLCDGHHLHGPYSIESMGSGAWEAMHGSQDELIAKTRALVAAMAGDFAQ